MARTPRSVSDETARTRKKNSSLFVAAVGARLRGAPVVDVAALDALVEIAKKYETVIVEVTEGERVDYLLWDDGLVFRFRTLGGDDAAEGDAGDTATDVDAEVTPLEQLRTGTSPDS